MIQRIHYQLLTERLIEKRRFIQVLFGPRQVGKTTLVEQVRKKVGLKSLSITADAVTVGSETWIEEQWQAARLQLLKDPDGEFLLIIDEIQKIANWSESVKKCWDQDTQNNLSLKVVLLGSSRLLLQQGLTESLAGRFETIYMGHWSFTEMQQAFGWTEEKFVWFGGYPGSASLISDEIRWKQYLMDSLIESSISRDILLLTRVDKPALMRRLFELGCMYSGQVLSYTKMLGQLLDAGNTTTLSHYLHLLDTAGLLGGLEKFAKNVIRTRASSPKFQVHNNALMSAQSSFTKIQIQSRADLWGRWVESAIGAHLLNSAIENNFKLYYWREGNAEVDYILEYQEQVITIEVKSGNSLQAGGLSVFRNKFSPDKIYKIGDALSWKELLCTNPLQLF